LDSGPTKGYSEAQAQRLEETEHALLLLLSVVTEDKIKEAFSDETQERLKRTRAQQPELSTSSTSQSNMNELRSINTVARWEQYPLSTADDIRRWAESCLPNHEWFRERARPDMRPEQSAQQAGDLGHPITLPRPMHTQDSSTTPHGELDTSEPAPPGAEMTQQRRFPSKQRATQAHNRAAEVTIQQQPAPIDPVESYRRSKQQNRRGLDLPDSFQQHFVW
jgi:hypothetical protein